MSEDKKTKNIDKRIYILVAVLLLLIGGGAYVWQAGLLNNTDEEDTTQESVDNTDTTDQNDSAQDPRENNQPPSTKPEYNTKSSSEAIAATNKRAKEWSKDAKLYQCSGVTFSSVQMPDKTYYFLGSEEGNYASWLCQYYSDSKSATLMLSYREGEIDVDLSEDVLQLDKYSKLTYSDVNYPSDVSKLADSSDVYETVLAEGLDPENNYYNMYLGDDYQKGYVWKVDERSKTEKDEYDTGVIVNTYYLDAESGELME
jgi:hypothetical protein